MVKHDDLLTVENFKNNGAYRSKSVGANVSYK